MLGDYLLQLEMEGESIDLVGKSQRDLVFVGVIVMSTCSSH
jgi:hypothetical protein